MNDNEPPLPAVPDPVKPGASGVRWTQIFAGFGLGIAIAWGLRLSLFALLASRIETSTEAALFAALFPTAVLVAAIFWAARTGRKAWAIGMAIYAGVGGLLVGGTAAIVYVACGNMTL